MIFSLSLSCLNTVVAGLLPLGRGSTLVRCFFFWGGWMAALPRGRLRDFWPRLLRAASASRFKRARRALAGSLEITLMPEEMVRCLLPNNAKARQKRRRLWL